MAGLNTGGDCRSGESQRPANWGDEGEERPKGGEPRKATLPGQLIPNGQVTDPVPQRYGTCWASGAIERSPLLFHRPVSHIPSLGGGLSMRFPRTCRSHRNNRGPLAVFQQEKSSRPDLLNRASLSRTGHGQQDIGDDEAQQQEFEGGLIPRLSD